MRVKRDLLLHPDRLKIVQLLAKRRLTAGQIKEELHDVAQATLYRHLKALVDHFEQTTVDERPIRGGVERTYATIESATMLGYDDIAEADSDEQFRFFATFVGLLLSDFGTYLEREDHDLANDRIGYSQVPLWLTPEEFDAFAGELRALIESRMGNEPAPGRRRHLLNIIALLGEGRSAE